MARPWGGSFSGRSGLVIFQFVTFQFRENNATFGADPLQGDPQQAIATYESLERMDAKRVMMRVKAGAQLPAMDDEIMLDELENWKWRVEMSALSAAILVTSSQCPHGLGLLPVALTWKRGGQWRPWPGTFEYTKGELDLGEPLKVGDFSFIEAKQWCQETVACKGFTYSGLWSDKEREGGVPRTVHFSSSDRLPGGGSGTGKQHSYVQKDNPRANCNPDDDAFKCPNNPYDCLGLSHDADVSSVKQAYRTLSKRMHPDKVKASARTKEAVKQAEKAFREISDAHENLRDPKKRREINQQLSQHKRRWEKERGSIQDLYIKEQRVSSLEPESYPVMLPKGQEWLVHFFLPDNDGCKQMKIVMGRAAKDLGTGEEERGVQSQRMIHHPIFRPKEVFRGVLRDKSTALRTEGATAAEGDTHLAAVVGDNNKLTLFVADESTEMNIESIPNEKDAKSHFKLTGKTRSFSGSFDPNKQWFRGEVAENSQPDRTVASFALHRDDYMGPGEVSSQPQAGRREKPRLFGAVNCGRFPEFCKRKGADPKMTKRFPQVRMLFPEDVRFELYRGKHSGKDLVSFAREASRPQGDASQLNSTSLAQLKTGTPSTWLVLLHRQTSAKAIWDCELCKTAFPMLRRTALRLKRAGIESGWLNCTAEEEETQCTELLFGDDQLEEEWGSLRLVQFGAGVGEKGFRSSPMWNSQLIMGEMSQQSLLATLEAVSRTAEFMHTATPGTAQKTEL